MTNIFTYGTLMFEEIWLQVVTGEYRKFRAILDGYDRKMARNEEYPVLYPHAPSSQVEGFVYLDVSDADLEKLDYFEGDYYFRKSEDVLVLESGKMVAAVYVLKEEYYSIISHKNWDPDYFKTQEIDLFKNKYDGFSQ
jgi:gamma-glutamylcyclotransferase (GGCT)/AIG2-like uncharacterized protein YtfP